MFIIFDLDDTLIDTSVCITPFQLKRALRLVQRKGFGFEESDCARLIEQHVRAPSGEAALKEFLEHQGIAGPLILEALQEYRALPDQNLAIHPVPHAIDVVRSLVDHKLAVVTLGREELQHYKLKKAGFFFDLFSKIVVVSDGNKKIHYELLLEEYGHSSERLRGGVKKSVVVGDRIESDLVPAKELGCCTVHFRRGRGVYERKRDEVVDFTMYSLCELPNIIARVKENGHK